MVYFIDVAQKGWKVELPQIVVVWAESKNVWVKAVNS